MPLIQRKFFFLGGKLALTSRESVIISFFTELIEELHSLFCAEQINLHDASVGQLGINGVRDKTRFFTLTILPRLAYIL